MAHTRDGGLGIVVLTPKARRAPPHAVNRGSSSSTPPQVGGFGFETSCSPHLIPVSRDPRAFRPAENRPSAHGAHALWRTWRCCLRGQRATRSTKCRWPRLFFTDTAPGRRLRLRKGRGHHMQLLWCAATMRFARGEQSDGPRSTRALETWRGCLRGRRATRSIPRCWPRHFFTDTAPGWHLRLRNVIIIA